MDSWQNNHLVFFTSPHHAVTILITRVKRRLRKWEVSVSKHFSFIDETTKKSAKRKSNFRDIFFLIVYLLLSELIISLYSDEKIAKLILKLTQQKYMSWIWLTSDKEKLFFIPTVLFVFSVLKKPQEKCLERQYICRLLLLWVVVTCCCCDLL